MIFPYFKHQKPINLRDYLCNKFSTVFFRSLFYYVFPKTKRESMPGVEQLFLLSFNEKAWFITGEPRIKIRQEESGIGYLLSLIFAS